MYMQDDFTVTAFHTPNSSSYFQYQHPTHYHPNISLNTIVRMLRKIRGTEKKKTYTALIILLLFILKGAMLI